MLRRFLYALAAAVASCTATPAFAQAPPAAPLAQAPPEPLPLPGTVALRIANATDCPMAVRVRKNGEVIGLAIVKPHALQWAHAKPGGTVLEVEVVASPQLCTAVIPPELLGAPAATTPPPSLERTTAMPGALATAGSRPPTR